MNPFHRAYGPFALCFLSLASDARAEDPLDWFPENTLLYVEARGLPRLADRLAGETRFRAWIDHLRVGFPDTAEGIGRVESVFEELSQRFGIPGDEVLPKVLGEHAAFGLLSRTFRPEPDWVLLARPVGELEGAFSRVVEFFRETSVPGLEPARHRGRRLAESEELTILEEGEWWLFTNDRVRARSLLDARLAKRASLRQHRDFLVERSSEVGFRAWVSPKLMPFVRDAEGLLAARGEPGASLLFGGVLEALQRARWLSLSLEVPPQGDPSVDLTIACEPLDPIAEKVWFPDSKPMRRLYLDHEEHLATLRLSRDFATWWNERSHLLGEVGLEKTREFAQGMSLFFGGRSFGDDVLATWSNGADLVFFRTREGNGTRPLVRIPPFAILAELRDPHTQFLPWRIAFQTAIGIVNVEAAQQATGSFLLEPWMHETNGSHGGEEGEASRTPVTTARYVDALRKDVPPIQANFSPSLALRGNTLVLTSSEDAIGPLFDPLVSNERGTGDEYEAAHDLLVIDGPSFRHVLRDDLDPLAMNVVLEEGLTLQEGRARVQHRIALLDPLERLTVAVARTPIGVRLRAELTWRR